MSSCPYCEHSLERYYSHTDSNMTSWWYYWCNFCGYQEIDDR